MGALLRNRAGRLSAGASLRCLRHPATIACAWRVAVTAFWTLTPLCWMAVYLTATTPPFGIPFWLYAFVHLSFWAFIVGKVWQSAKARGEAR